MNIILKVVLCFGLMVNVAVLLFAFAIKINRPQKMLAEIDQILQAYDPRDYLTVSRSLRDDCIEWALGKDWFDIKWNDRAGVFRDRHPTLDSNDFNDATETMLFYERVSKAYLKAKS